jgi:hypothetical protein
MIREIKSWDSDHTALVHVLWSANYLGLLDPNTDYDRLARHIMQSDWLEAVKQHAAAPPTPVHKTNPKEFWDNQRDLGNV